MKPLFETARLEVRALVESDFDDMLVTYGDPDAMRYVGDGTPLSAEDCRRWIEITHRNYETRGYGMACICLKGGGETVGFCGLTHPGNQVDAEFKYTLQRRFWGMGFATEVGRAMLSYAEGELGLTRIIATVDGAHTASQNVLRKCGFAYESSDFEEGGHETALWVKLADA